MFRVDYIDAICELKQKEDEMILQKQLLCIKKEFKSLLVNEKDPGLFLQNVHRADLPWVHLNEFYITVQATIADIRSLLKYTPRFHRESYTSKLANKIKICEEISQGLNKVLNNKYNILLKSLLH